MSKSLLYEEEREQDQIQRFYINPENFEKDINSDIDEEIKNSKKEYLEECKEVANELGLVAQANSYHRQINEITYPIKSHSTKYPELSKEDFELYKIYFPTEYDSMLKWGDEMNKPMQSYSFDEVPLNVLKAFKEAKESEEFNHFLILTPEKKKRPKRVVTDPILIGVKFMDDYASTKRFYLIAKWGKDRIIEKSNILNRMMFRYSKFILLWCLYFSLCPLAFHTDPFLGMVSIPLLAIGFLAWVVNFHKEEFSCKQFKFLCKQFVFNRG